MVARLSTHYSKLPEGNVFRSYHVGDVLVDGVSAGAVETLTFSDEPRKI